MGITKIIFWLLAVVAFSGGIGIIASRKPVYSVFSLIVVFFALSGFFILMDARFIAVVNIVIYAGAISALILFAVMLMRGNRQVHFAREILLKLAGVITALTLMILFVAAFAHAEQNSISVRPGTNVGFAQNLGKVLFDKYIIPFELTGLLFLSAIAGIVITGKNERNIEN